MAPRARLRTHFAQAGQLGYRTLMLLARGKKILPISVLACRCAISVALLSFLGPPLIWTIVNLSGPNWDVPPRDGNSEWTEPLLLLATLGLLSAITVLSAFIIRRRSIVEIAWLVCLIESSGVAVLLIAVAAPMTMPSGRAVQYEPTPVIDQTAFAKTYFKLQEATPGPLGEYVKRHSFVLDEYGIRPEKEIPGFPWIGLWEEYGLPFRCARYPGHFGLPRPDRIKYIAALPDIFAELRLRPFLLAVNTLIVAALIFSAITLPKWVRSRHRSQADCCPNCGYFVRDLHRCPECGKYMRLHRRGVEIASNDSNGQDL